MEDYNEEKHIRVREAKEYAMNRRFEVAPSKRVRVIISREDDRASFAGFETIEDYGGYTLPVIGKEVESKRAWIFKKGCVHVFDRAEFFALFAEYPTKESER